MTTPFGAAAPRTCRPTRHLARSRLCAALCQMSWLLLAGVALADTPSAPQSTNLPSQSSAPDLSRLDAFRAVQEANKKLLAGDADRALELYDHAAQQEPNAREIAFGKGLSHYAKQEFERAKDEFLNAATGKNDGLAGDAAYAAAACDHTEALAASGDLKPAISKLENAMRGYRDVLGTHPNHPAARDANRKAATMWRELKKQLQQQQKQNETEKQNQEQDPNEDQQEQDQKKDGDQGENQKENQQEPSDPNQKKSSPQNQSGDNKQQESPEQKQDRQSPKEQEEGAQNEQKDAQADAESEPANEPKDEREAQAMKEQKEDASREQAERKLREMMQAVRQRKKDHRETHQPVYVMPVDKDW